MFCDLAGIALGASSRARQQTGEVTGIPVENIAITATHSHTGPMYFGALRKHFHQRAIEQLGDDPREKIGYSASLVERLVSAIKQADESLSPIRLEAGYASEDRLSFNRRFHMKDGSVRFNPGQLNSNIDRAAGPIDPQVDVVMLNSAVHKMPLAAIVSFALHLDTVGGTEYSADYPKFVQDHLRKSMGTDFVSMFGAGTCGDINHIDVTIHGRRSAEEIGTMLAGSIDKHLPNLAPVDEPSLAVRSTTVNAPLQVYSNEEIVAARRNMKFVDSRKLAFLERVKVYTIMALQLHNSKTMPIEVQVFRLSRDVAIVTLPGEVFVELGMAIKAASPFKTTLVIELANDAPGYLPTRKAFVEGSYETVNSRITTGGGEMMVAAATHLLKGFDK